LVLVVVNFQEERNFNTESDKSICSYARFAMPAFSKSGLHTNGDKESCLIFPSMGFVNAAALTTTAKSAAGQVLVGTIRQDNTCMECSFLANFLFRDLTV